MLGVPMRPAVSSNHRHRDGARADRRAGLGLAGLLLLAFCLRAAWILLADVAPDQGFQFDMTWYHGMARRIAEGSGMTRQIGAPTAEWPPGYPLLLAAVYALTDTNVLAAQILNALLSTATCWLTYVIADRCVGRRCGLLAAALLAFAPGEIFYAPLLLSETAFTAVLAAACAVFVCSRAARPQPTAAHVGVGLVLGLATLVRGIGLGFVVALIPTWLGSPPSWRRTVAAAAPVATVALGVLVALTPWTVRNFLRLGAFVPVSTSLGRTLAHAHSPVETGTRSIAAMEYRVALWKSFEDVPQPRRELDVNAAFTRDALGYMATHPARELALIPVRLRYLYGSDHAALEWGRKIAKAPHAAKAERLPLVAAVSDDTLAAAADWYFFALLACAVAGMVVCMRSGEVTARLVPAAIVYFSVFHSVLFPGEPRYHYPAVPFLAIAAAAALDRLPVLLAGTRR